MNQLFAVPEAGTKIWQFLTRLCDLDVVTNVVETTGVCWNSRVVMLYYISVLSFSLLQ